MGGIFSLRNIGVRQGAEIFLSKEISPYLIYIVLHRYRPRHAKYGVDGEAEASGHLTNIIEKKVNKPDPYVGEKRNFDGDFVTPYLLFIFYIISYLFLICYF